MRNFDRLSSVYERDISSSLSLEHFKQAKTTEDGNSRKLKEALGGKERDFEFPQYQYKPKPKGDLYHFSNNPSNLAEKGANSSSLSANGQTVLSSMEIPQSVQRSHRVDNPIYNRVNWIPSLNPFHQKYEEFHQGRESFRESMTVKPQENDSVALNAKTKQKLFEISEENPKNEVVKSGTEHWGSMQQSRLVFDPNAPRNSSKIPDWAVSDRKSQHKTVSLTKKSDYAINYGELGHNPKDIMDRKATFFAKTNEPLKYS